MWNICSYAYLPSVYLLWWSVFEVFDPFFKIYLFLIMLGLRCRMGFSLVAENGGYSLVVVYGLLLQRLLLLLCTGSRVHGLQ